MSSDPNSLRPQKYLTGSGKVGNVEDAIDRHTANYLENTGRFNKRMHAATGAAILRSAEHQKSHEVRGLVSARKGPMWGRAFAGLSTHSQPRRGVIHTPDGFLLRTAGSRASKKGRVTSLDLLGANECACEGSNNEDKGPKCACKGDPEFAPVDEVFSPEEVTRWPQVPAAAPSNAEAEAAFAKELAEKAAEQDAMFKAKEAVPVSEKAPSLQTLKNLQPTVEATQDGINTFLQDVLISAEAKKGASVAALSKLRRTVEKLQGVATREPQMRPYMAVRLNKLARTVLAPSSGQQALTDYTNVYVPPDVDDLDNYLQGVLDEVSRTEIPTLDEDEAAAKKAPASGAMLRTTKQAVHVEATQDGINTFLQDVLMSVRHGKNPVNANTMVSLKSTVKQLQDVSARDPQARDLLAFRLNKLAKTFITPPSGQQALTDYTNVYVPPDVDDLDNYLQGVLDEVSRTEIPTLDDDEAAAKKAPASGVMLKGTMIGVSPTAGAISQTLHEMMEAVAKLHAKDKGLVHLRETVSQVEAVAVKVPASRDLIAERLSDVRRVTHEAAKNTQALTDYTNVYVPPDVDDLDNYLQGVLDEVSRTEIPTLDDDEAAAKKGHLQSLMPLDPTRNLWGKAHAKFRGDFLDKMEWRNHVFDTHPEEAQNLAKATEDVVAPMDVAMVHGAPNMRVESHGADHVRNAYGYLRDDASAEVPVTTPNSMDTARATGVLTEASLDRGAKLCETVNCDGDGPNGPPSEDEPAAPVAPAEPATAAEAAEAMQQFQESNAVPEESDGMGAPGTAQAKIEDAVRKVMSMHQSKGPGMHKARRSSGVPVPL